VLEDSVAREKISRVREQVAGDVSFADALVATGLFDEFYSGLIRMGCTVGCADVVMGKVASEYETRVEDGIASLVSIIEPSLVAILSIVIGAVLLSVMLPMAGIISSIL
jgi:type IV pilus assembly protein PilC